MKPITQIESQDHPNDALLLARLAAEEQNRFARRLVAGLIAFMLLWLAALLYFKQPALRLLGRTQQVQAAHVSDTTLPGTRVDQLNRELNRLQQQLGSALTQTLAMKLEALEERIRLGRAGLQDLELIQSIRQDIRVLMNRSGNQPPRVVHSQISGSVAAAPVATEAGPEPMLLEKMIHLENLLYLSLGSFTLMTVAVAGYLFRCGTRLRRLDTDLTQLRYRVEHQQH